MWQSADCCERMRRACKSGRAQSVSDERGRGASVGSAGFRHSMPRNRAQSSGARTTQIQTTQTSRAHSSYFFLCPSRSAARRRNAARRADVLVDVASLADPQFDPLWMHFCHSICATLCHLNVSTLLQMDVRANQPTSAQSVPAKSSAVTRE